MKFLITPKPDCIIEASAEEAEKMCFNGGGFTVKHKEAQFWLIHGKWIMILPPEPETEKDAKTKESKRD